MSLLLVGLNHRTAPLEVREQLAFSEQTCARHLQELADGGIVRETLILSTCNRVELLVETVDETIGFDRIVNFLAKTKKLDPRIFEGHLYSFAEAEAVRHLFRVAASLDSMIVGETQILAQVKQAYKIASEAGTTNRNLHKLLHHAFHTAKRVRTETAIGSNAVSISYAAIEKARQIFGSLEGKTVLLVGAGEMAELAAKNLIGNGARKIFIANRTHANAVRLASEFGGEAVEFADLNQFLPQADVVICSTAANAYLIDAKAVAESQTSRQDRPALFIDISVPRNIAPEVGEIKNVFLLDVDDLQNAISENRRQRESEAKLAEAIIEEETAEFEVLRRTLDFGETLGLVREKMQDNARSEFQMQRAKLGTLTPEQERAVQQLLISTVNKLAHPILYGLRRSHELHGSREFADILCSLLGETKAKNQKLQVESLDSEPLE